MPLPYYRLARELQLFLLAPLGILSTKNPLIGSGRCAASLVLQPPWAVRFHEHLGFAVPRKRAQLETWLAGQPRSDPRQQGPFIWTERVSVECRGRRPLFDLPTRNGGLVLTNGVLASAVKGGVLMLLVRGKKKRMPPTLGRMVAEASARLASSLLAGSNRRTPARSLEELATARRVDVLLLVAREAVSLDAPELFPSLWCDASVVAVFDFIGDVVQDREAGHLAINYRSNMRRIVIHPDICNGQPTIQGTRIAVHTVHAFLSAGDPIDDVRHNIPPSPVTISSPASPIPRR